MKHLFSFKSYKAYLAHVEEERNRFSRGFRSRLAKAIGCNNAFVSQVLNTHANFSLEQGLSICQFLELSDDEERYFLFLIDHDRAGTAALKEHFRRLLDEISVKYLNIKDRVKHEHVSLSGEAEARYYSQWYYAAIHMLVGLPEFRKKQEIASALRLSEGIVERVITFLLSNQLLVEKDGRFLPGPSYLHLQRDSPNIPKHHTNWRMQAVQSLEFDDHEDVHYSTISTFSREDAEHLRAKFVDEIQSYVKTVSASKKEETMYCFNLDFFKMVR